MPYREPTRRAHSLDNRFRTPENRVLGNWTGNAASAHATWS
jgi:hypothetical protein